MIVCKFATKLDYQEDKGIDLVVSRCIHCRGHTELIANLELAAELIHHR